MNTNLAHNQFIFNEKINTQCISDLYGDDMPYIEEVFGTVLLEYEMLVRNIHEQFKTKNVLALKAAVHKIKPIFGFTGLVTVQQHCQQFEDQCQSTISFDSLAENYSELYQDFDLSKIIIVEEKRKLEQFNRQ